VGLAHLLSVSGLHLTAVVGARSSVSLRLLALSPALALAGALVWFAAGARRARRIAYTIITGASADHSLAGRGLLVLAGIGLGARP
jgi:competence protein ComEC